AKGGIADDVVLGLERKRLRVGTVVRRQAAGLAGVTEQRGGGKQGGVVLVAAIGRVAARRGHLRGTLRAGQERIGRLRVRTGGRVVQVVQVLAHHGVADEVRDTLVPVRHTDEAGGSEVPLHVEVEVVGLERQQRR